MLHLNTLGGDDDISTHNRAPTVGKAQNKLTSRLPVMASYLVLCDLVSMFKQGSAGKHTISLLKLNLYEQTQQTLLLSIKFLCCK